MHDVSIPLIGRVIRDFYFSQRLTSGPTDISSSDVTAFVVSRFWRNAADKREDRCFDTQIHDVLPHRKKNKKLNMQVTIIYKEYCPILLSGLKIENTFKMQKWISHLYRPLSRKKLRDFRRWRILENDAIWNVYNFSFLSKERIHENQGLA
jgi:hypothetical protein